MSLIAAVDGPDEQHLTAVKIFTFPLGGIPEANSPRTWDFMRSVGLTRWPNRWVDITDRPDIKEGEPFPFKRKES